MYIYINMKLSKNKINKIKKTKNQSRKKFLKRKRNKKKKEVLEKKTIFKSKKENYKKKQRGWFKKCLYIKFFK